MFRYLKLECSDFRLMAIMPDQLGLSPDDARAAMTGGWPQEEVCHLAQRMWHAARELAHMEPAGRC